MTKPTHRPAPARAPAPTDRPGSRWSEASPAPEPAPETSGPEPPGPGTDDPGPAAAPAAAPSGDGGHAAIDERMKRGVAAAGLTPEEEDAMRRRLGGDRRKILAELARIVKTARAAEAAPAQPERPQGRPQGPAADDNGPALNAETAAQVNAALTEEGIVASTVKRVLAEALGADGLATVTRAALETAAARVGLKPPEHTATADLAVAVLTRLAKPAPPSADRGAADLRAALVRIADRVAATLDEIRGLIRTLDGSASPQPGDTGQPATLATTAAAGGRTTTAAEPTAAPRSEGNSGAGPVNANGPHTGTGSTGPTAAAAAAEPPGLDRDERLKVVAEMRRAKIADADIQATVRDKIGVSNLGHASREMIEGAHAAIDERIKRGVAAAGLTPEEEDAMRRRLSGDRSKILAELSRIVKAARAAEAAFAPAGGPEGPAPRGGSPGPRRGGGGEGRGGPRRGGRRRVDPQAGGSSPTASVWAGSRR